MQIPNKNEQEKNKIEEPSIAYTAQASNSMHFFQSNEEEQLDHYKWLASLTPLQHLENGTKNIKRIYAEELRSNPSIEPNLIINF
jgi:hypothetical protein